MNTAEQLIQVFNDNFVGYYRSHVAHVNIEGRNFYSDHKLLQKVYEDLQDQIDSIAEKIRTLGEYMPCEIQDVLNNSHISTAELWGDSDYLISKVCTDLEHLVTEYQSLIEISTMEGHDEIANYAQDRISTLNRFIWMLKATES
jgi:starvation-inducible DNA-binding protein